MAAHARRHLFTVEEYEQMIAVGIFHEDDRIELIEGEVVQLAAVGVKHANCSRGAIVC